MKVLIAGAAGFIGCNLADYYLRQGCTVTGVDNLCTGSAENIQWLKRHKNFSFIKYDVTVPLEIPGRIDLICDLACPASPVDFGPLNLEILDVCSRGVSNLLQLASEKGARFLHTSTSEVYGDPQVHPQREDYWGHVNPIGLRSVYDEGKRFAEAMIMAYHRRNHLPIRIARIFNTYGPRMRLDDGRVITNFIKQALLGQSLSVQGDGSQTRSFCYIDDQVDGLVKLAASDYQLPVNIGNPQEISILQLAGEIIHMTGSSSRIAHTALPADDPTKRRPDITLAKRILGWQPKVDRTHGLHLTIDFFREFLKAPHDLEVEMMKGAT